MAVAGGAAEVPVLGYLTVGLLAAVAWVVLVGMRATWQYTLGYILGALGGWKVSTGIFGSVHPLGFLERVNRDVLNGLEIAAHKAEHAMGYLFHGAAVIQGWIAKEAYAFGAEVYDWAYWLQHVHMPRWTRAILYTLVPPLAIRAALHAAAHGGTTVIERVITGRIGLTRRQVRAMIAAAVAGLAGTALPHVHIFPRFAGIPRELGRLRKRLRRVELLVAGAGAVALVGTALGKLGLNWIRCSNVAKAGKALCRADAKWLENLLLGTLAILGTLSLRTFAIEVYALTGEAARAVGHFWRADVSSSPIDPALGETGGPAALHDPRGWLAPNPQLGDVS